MSHLPVFFLIPSALASARGRVTLILSPSWILYTASRRQNLKRWCFKNTFTTIFSMVRIAYKTMVRRKIRTPEIARLSSKGQVVIPKGIREALKLEPGTPLAVDVSRGMIIMKPIRSPIEEEDLRALEEVGEAWDEIERGEYRRARVKDFLMEIRKW